MNFYAYVTRTWRQHVAIHMNAYRYGREPYVHIQDKVV